MDYFIDSHIYVTYTNYISIFSEFPYFLYTTGVSSNNSHAAKGIFVSSVRYPLTVCKKSYISTSS
jgi:hypothetical protein